MWTYNEAVVLEDVHLAHGTGTMLHKPRVNAASVELMSATKQIPINNICPYFLPLYCLIWAIKVLDTYLSSLETSSSFTQLVLFLKTSVTLYSLFKNKCITSCTRRKCSGAHPPSGTTRYTRNSHLVMTSFFLHLKNNITTLDTCKRLPNIVCLGNPSDPQYWDVENTSGTVFSSNMTLLTRF